MIKYCFVTDEETGLVQLGVGCPDEYYIEIGMKQRDVEQSEIDYQWYLTELCPHYTEEEKELIKRQEKIDEIDSKIFELKTLSINEILYNNIENIKVYQDVIRGLEETKANL